MPYWVMMLILYLAAGGVVNFLLHAFACISRTHEKNHPELTEYDKDTIPWRIFSWLMFFVMVASVPLVLPALSTFFDARHTSQLLDQNDTKIFWIKKQLADRCVECRNEGRAYPFEACECLPGEDTLDGRPRI